MCPTGNALKWTELQQHLEVLDAAGAAGKHWRYEGAEEDTEQALVIALWSTLLQDLHPGLTSSYPAAGPVLTKASICH